METERTANACKILIDIRDHIQHVCSTNTKPNYDYLLTALNATLERLTPPTIERCDTCGLPLAIDEEITCHDGQTV